MFHEPALMEQYAEETTSFRAFFHEVEASGKSFSDVMGMWEILKNYDADVQKTAVAFGRLALNRGYAASTASAQGMLSFNYYSGGNASDFTKLLLRKTVDLHTDTNNAVNSAQFLETAPTAYYDLADTIDWSQIWGAAAELAKSSEWQIERKKIEMEILRIHDDQDFDIEKWNSIFDKINGHFQDIRFELIGGPERPAVQLIKTEMGKHPTYKNAKNLGSALIGLTGLTNLLSSINEVLAGKCGASRSLSMIRKLRRHSSKDHPMFENVDLVISNAR